MGVEDYGIYNIVGGIVAMLGFFNSSMSVATQRYMSYDIGKNDFKKLNKTFNSSLLIYIFIGLLIVILLETVGLWYVNNRLVFPPEKSFSVNVVYQFSILTFLVNLTQLPYNALILAREKMQVYTYVSFLDTILKLVVLYLLFLGENKLILYSGLIFAATVIVQIVYHVYCHKRFEETKINFTRDKEYLKELLSFSGWNLFGSIAVVARNQGVNLVLNVFFGLVINAAFSISILVQNAVGSFVANFQKALNPQIIKNYADGNHENAIKLMSEGAKYSFYLMLFFAIPLLIHTQYILSVWLTDVPHYTVIFVRLSIVVSLINTISGTLMTMLQAIGKIKWYQIIDGFLVFLNLPLSYIFLKITEKPEIVYVVIIAISIISFIPRVILLRKYISFNISSFFLKIILNIFIIVVALSTVFLLSMRFFLATDNLFKFFICLSIEFLIIFITIFYLGIGKNERKILFQLIVRKK
ncbi:MATE family efflux transporter [Flavobacterium dauae]|uniref:MATE family efflux transporter n=1 Tax=Flavobacterium dauae TaxID=1563479 RepID=UPI001EFF0FA8|nr:MATE family efflux transporter [Flavobacterium dauae]WLD24698.1 MATE family efflux transporter [Flavobacterium dauae]